MGVMKRVVKAKRQRTKRALEAREPKAVETIKPALLVVGGPKCSAPTVSFLKQLHALKKHDAAGESDTASSHFYSKRQRNMEMGHPFIEPQGLTAACVKHDAGLFAIGSHNKKRPHNLVMGRMYDRQILDMVELGLDPETFRSLNDFSGEKIPVGTKPCLLFSGPAFKSSPEMQRLQNLLVDFFRGPVVTNVRLAGLEHAIQFTAFEDTPGSFKVMLRSYRVVMKKSGGGSNVPRVELEEMGPRADFVVRRSHLSSDDLFKTACKQVKNVNKVKKVKNITEDGLGGTLGRVHVPAQNISSIQTRKMKGLKETPEEKKLEKMKLKKEKAEKARKSNIEAVFGDS